MRDLGSVFTHVDWPVPLLHVVRGKKIHHAGKL